MNRRDAMRAIGGAVAVGGVAGAQTTPAPWASLVNGLLTEDGIRVSLGARMAYYGVPGVSIAVLRRGSIAWSRGFGVLQAGKRDAVTDSTLFQVASVSKPVTAMAVFRMARLGLIAVDRPINAQLRSWKLPDAVRGAGFAARVTPRHLMSHIGGVSVHGFLGYRSGLRVPTLRQVLDGVSPANSPPVRAFQPPGEFVYSGGGYAALQQLVEDASKAPFAKAMAARVLQPLGMTTGGYGPPPSGASVASGHRGNGSVLPGRWHTYPEQGAAGLWATAREIALFFREVGRAAYGLKGAVLTQADARAMITPVTPGMGAGLFVGSSGAASFYHTGVNEGYRAIGMALRDVGGGVAILTNGDNGLALSGEILRGLAAIERWPAFLL